MAGRAGTVVAIGGAEERTRDGRVLQRFVELCGGERARVVVIPTASQLENTGPEYEQVFEELGVRWVRILPLQHRSDCSRPEHLSFLAEAEGVFLTGGNQLRLAKVLCGTPVADLLGRRIREEPVVIAGTSAGAAILSEHMIAYGEEGVAPRAGIAALAPGLGLLPEIIVDQHFSQRNRLGRLLLALAYNPRLLGLGVDENTAAVIPPDGQLEVVGPSLVTLVDAAELVHASVDEAERGQPVSLSHLRLHFLTGGDRFDLPDRRYAGRATEGSGAVGSWDSGALRRLVREPP
jgi:cyanophycinase